MADPAKTSQPAPSKSPGGAPSESDMASFPPVQANPASPLDEVAEPYSTHMTRQDLATSAGAAAEESATSHTLSGNAEPDAITSAPLPSGGPRERSPRSSEAGEGAAGAAAKSPPPSQSPPASPSKSPDSADAADAATLAQLLDARVLEPPDAAAGQRGAVAILDKRYELRRKLGEGGMGIVFLAFDKLGDCEVAIKTLRPRFLSDAESRKRFIDEAKQMNKVPSHAHVLVVKGFGTENRPYYVMENMAGGSLGKLIRKDGPLPRDKALALAIDIAKAIEYLHESSGQIHRDIKPENVLLAADGSAWLCDFGLIRQVGIGAQGLRAGTLAYMPPEVVTDQTKNVAFDWDIYSFGAVLYEMICGKRPYDELFTNSKSNPIEQMKLMKDEVTRRPPKPIHEVCRKADPSLAKISQWCMAREPRDRYYRMKDVLRDLHRIEKGKAPLGPRQFIESTGGALHYARRLVAGLALLLVATAAWIWFANPFNLRHDILHALGVKTSDSPTVPTTDRANPSGLTDSGKDKVATDGKVTPVSTNPIPATGHAILDAVNPDVEMKASVKTTQGRTSYVEGEIISLEVTYNRACYPLVLWVSLDHPSEPVTVLFPNRWQLEDRLPPPGEPLLIPSEAARREGIVVRVVPPHGRHLIKVIASNPPLVLTDGENHLQEGFALLDPNKLKVAPAEGGAGPFMKIEEVLKRPQWTTAELVITTREK